MFHGLPVEDVTIVSGDSYWAAAIFGVAELSHRFIFRFFESLVSAYNVSGFVLQRRLRVALRFLRLTSLHLV